MKPKEKAIGRYRLRKVMDKGAMGVVRPACDDMIKRKVAIKPTAAVAINETVLGLSNPKRCLKLSRSLATTLSERLREHDARYSGLISDLKREPTS